MLKHCRRLLTGAVAAAAAGTIAATGIAAASATPRAGTAVSGTEQFQIMTTSATSTQSSLIASGVFTAWGAMASTWAYRARKCLRVPVSLSGMAVHLAVRNPLTRDCSKPLSVVADSSTCSGASHQDGPSRVAA
jgi:hypothetical protein